MYRKDNYCRILNYLEDKPTTDLGTLSTEIFKLLLAENRPITLNYITEKTRNGY